MIPLSFEAVAARSAEFAQRYPQAQSAVMPALNWVQSIEGWVSTDSMRAIAEGLGVTPAYVQQFASFYTMFRLQPVGRRTVSVCTTLSCMLAGSDATLAAFAERTGAGTFGTSEDGEWFLERIECVGACDLAPAVQLDNGFPERVRRDEVDAFVARAAAAPITPYSAITSPQLADADAPGVEKDA